MGRRRPAPTSGITFPGFPNLFCLYGPNTNIVINGCIVYFSECEVRYVTRLPRLLLDGGHRALDCRQDVHDAYNAAVDAENRKMAWGASTVNSWYKNASGPGRAELAVHPAGVLAANAEPDPADYRLTDRVAARAGRSGRSADMDEPRLSVVESAGKNDSIESSASVMSRAVPNVASVLKNVSSSPAGVRRQNGTNSMDAGSTAVVGASSTPG